MTVGTNRNDVFGMIRASVRHPIQVVYFQEGSPVPVEKRRGEVAAPADAPSTLER